MLRAHQRQRPGTLPWEWPYWVGGVGLALINAVILASSDRPWGVTTPLTHAGSRLLQAIGFEPEGWAYFNAVGRDILLTQFGWWDSGLWLNLGVLAGSSAASLLTHEFRLRPWPRAWRPLLLSLGGGVLMGYGARLALGCSVGALIGGIASYSLHGWAFLLAVFPGVLTGIALFRRLL